MQRRNHYLFWLSALTLQMLFLGCTSEAERREAELERRDAQREQQHQQALVVMQQEFDKWVQQAGQHCPEGAAGLRKLFAEYPSLMVQINGKTEPVGQFASDVARAAATHDATKSCARLVDSVAKAMLAHARG